MFRELVLVPLVELLSLFVVESRLRLIGTIELMVLVTTRSARGSVLIAERILVDGVMGIVFAR